jgi:hypothetical protein
MLARRWWADAPMNDGLFVRWGAIATLMGAAPGVARGFHMNLRVTITIKFEIAATAYGLAALLWLLS